MKSPVLFTAIASVVWLFPACESKDKKVAQPALTRDQELVLADTPILPVTVGDTWKYDVHLNIPPDVTSAGAAEVNTKHERIRTYLGKIAAAEGLPATDCFQVSVQGSPDEREFVEIYPDKILMRGSLIMRPETTKPMWLDKPVPFVIAGMKPGSSLPELTTPGGALSRKIQVIARETIQVHAGNFPCIKILTTGNDGSIELRRTIWYAPGKGIIREEKSRYRLEKLLYRETQELVELKQNPQGK